MDIAKKGIDYFYRFIESYSWLYEVLERKNIVYQVDILVIFLTNSEDQ